MPAAGGGVFRARFLVFPYWFRRRRSYLYTMNSALRVALIGPNAITQLTGALARELGRDCAQTMLRANGFGKYLDCPPRGMVDELDVIELHSAVRERLPGGVFRSVELAAGRSTADYLLAHRIPAAWQRLMHLLPTAVRTRLLLTAITRHAWTFAGSGRCTGRAGRPVAITIEGCAICCGAHANGPQCAYYAATFERLFAALVDRRAVAVETDCIAAGAPVCRFQIDWPGSR
jgi:divinyl protochlorophyllide a 8-vinyl-reductase